MSDQEGIKSVIEKYCPVVKHNVAVEVTRCGYKELGSCCLNKETCEKQSGGCSNSFINF